MLKGYQSPEYAKTFETQGRLLRLNIGLRGAFLERDILSTGYKDITSLYPVHHTSETDLIGFDSNYIRQVSEQIFLDLKKQDVVSILLISDPLNPFIERYLKRKHWRCPYENTGFDTLEKYKDHYIVQLQEPLKIASNHTRNIKDATKNNIQINNVILSSNNINKYTNQFFDLYSILVKRHNIIGFPNFSLSQILSQLIVPGTILLEAIKNGEPLGYMLFYIEDENVRYHLGCYSDKGYDNKVSFKLMAEAIDFFKQLGLKNLVLGGSSGSGEKDGLDRFKSGWTDSIKENYILFKVLNKDIYRLLSNGKTGNFLPLYRSNS